MADEQSGHEVPFSAHTRSWFQAALSQQYRCPVGLSHKMPDIGGKFALTGWHEGVQASAVVAVIERSNATMILDSILNNWSIQTKTDRFYLLIKSSNL